MNRAELVELSANAKASAGAEANTAIEAIALGMTSASNAELINPESARGERLIIGSESQRVTASVVLNETSAEVIVETAMTDAMIPSPEAPSSLASSAVWRRDATAMPAMPVIIVPNDLNSVDKLSKSVSFAYALLSSDYALIA
jgi:hypothetical protein